MHSQNRVLSNQSRRQVQKILFCSLKLKRVLCILEIWICNNFFYYEFLNHPPPPRLLKKEKHNLHTLQKIPPCKCNLSDHLYYLSKQVAIFVRKSRGLRLRKKKLDGILTFKNLQRDL